MEVIRGGGGGGEGRKLRDIVVKAAQQEKGSSETLKANLERKDTSTCNNKI